MWFGKKEKEVSKDESIRQELDVISKNLFIESNVDCFSTIDPYSIVCLVTEEMPDKRKSLHIAECVADFMLHECSGNNSQKWYNSTRNSKKDKIVVYEVPIEDMSRLFEHHQKLITYKNEVLFQSASNMIYNGKLYPVAFCLGFMYARQQSDFISYKKYTL